MRKAKHYGVEVTIQYCDSFRTELKKSGISFTDLPLLEPDVLTYEYNQHQMYAIVKPCEDGEKVYLTSQVPLDMSWENLMRDCDSQVAGADPEELHTRAYILLQDAIKVAREVRIKEEEHFSFVPVEPTDKEIVNALAIHNGISVDDLMNMDHHDIDPDTLDSLRRV